jgi:hypothetical protein
MDFHDIISNAFNRAQNNNLNNFDMLSFIDKSPTKKELMFIIDYILLLEKHNFGITLVF